MSNDFLVRITMIIASKHLNIFFLHFLRGGNNLSISLCVHFLLLARRNAWKWTISYFGESKKSTADHGIKANVLSLVSDSIQVIITHAFIGQSW